MASNRYLKRNSWILGAAVVLGATSACATSSVSEATAAQDAVNLAANSTTETTPEASWPNAERSYRPLESGVRKAAMQGPEALRRYIWRTRMIYDYYFWDFVKKE